MAIVSTPDPLLDSHQQLVGEILLILDEAVDSKEAWSAYNIAERIAELLENYMVKQ